MNEVKMQVVNEIEKDLEVAISQLELSVTILEEFFGSNEYFDGLKKDTMEKFKSLISKASFILKIIENAFIWKLLDRDTKSVYRLLKTIDTLSKKGADNA